MKLVVGAMSFLLLVASADDISEQCRVHENTHVFCRCVGSEEFSLPDGYNFENVTSLHLASCAFANLHFSSLTEANRIAEIVVEDVSERLNFELYLPSKRMKRLKLSRIHRIPSITHDTFASLNSIETVQIENTCIENFAEQFTDIAVTNFSMTNVTVERLIGGLTFAEKGRRLRIENSRFQNVTGPLNFAYFKSVEIRASTFELQKPGHLLIEADVVAIGNSVFSNASMNLVAGSAITMNATCADGKSSLRLSSSRIESLNNRLPTEIIYTRNNRDSGYFRNRNNTVCIAGDCKCPKGSGQSTRQTIFLAFVLEFLLLLL